MRTVVWGKARKAFTLIELLVVISIIALLISLLLPALGAARGSALDLKCISNMKQLGISWHQYVTDYRVIPGAQMNADLGGDVYSINASYSNFNGAGPFGGRGNIMTWGQYLDFANPPLNETKYGPVGIGYLWDYIRDDGKLFFCPSNPASFDRSENKYSDYQSTWYTRWNHRPDSELSASASPNWGFGEVGRRAACLYWYRGAEHYTQRPAEALAAGTATWVNTWHVYGGVQRELKPDDSILVGKAWLTDYYMSIHGDTGIVNPPSAAMAPHRGQTTSLAIYDGSVSLWRLPRGVSAWQDWYDGFSNRTSSTGFVGNDFYNQAPWWWVLADNKTEG